MMFDVCSRVLEAAGFSRLGEGNNSVNIYYCYRQERMNVVFVWAGYTGNVPGNY